MILTNSYLKLLLMSSIACEQDEQQFVCCRVRRTKQEKEMSTMLYNSPIIEGI